MSSTARRRGKAAVSAKSVVTRKKKKRGKDSNATTTDATSGEPSAASNVREGQRKERETGVQHRNFSQSR
ncbi:hypothetical protein U1Q18_033247 [Sarracenia purpurea var. burkii]